MTTHWSKYKKATLKFNSQFSEDSAACLKLADEFLNTNKNIITDIKAKWDYGDKQTGFHLNLYFKSKDWQTLRRRYQGTDRVDIRLFLWIDDLKDIDDSCDWISYMYMREKLNYAMEKRRRMLHFD